MPLRARVDAIRDALIEGLPGDYASSAAVIREVSRDADAVSGTLVWPVTAAVEAKALADGSNAAFDDGLALLAELTERFTSEFAIRGFLRHDPERALAVCLGWTEAENPHVRRLASEGTRPFLPWGVRYPAVISAPELTIPILDRLYRDASEYVRRSVANHLNDHSRLVPELVLETARRWEGAPESHTTWVVRHALRTLVKKGDPGALTLLGFGQAEVDVTGPTVGAAVVRMSESIRFTGRIRNAGTEPVRLAIDYIVHHQKANGTQTGKTFKLTTATLGPGESLEIDRVHSFRPISTRRYHPGPHAIELQVNGVRSGRAGFELRAE